MTTHVSRPLGPAGARGGVASRGSAVWAGWIAFAGVAMIVAGLLDVLEGLIAVTRGRYFVIAGDELVFFDHATWGWIVFAWGLVVLTAGFGLLTAAAWARWFTIAAAGVSIVLELLFLGATTSEVWGLTIVAFNTIVLYALLVHWYDAELESVGDGTP